MRRFVLNSSVASFRSLPAVLSPPPATYRHESHESHNIHSDTPNICHSVPMPPSVSADALPLRRPALPPTDAPGSALLRCIEKEIQDETLRLDKEDGPPPPPRGWEMYHAEGTSLFYGRRCWMGPSRRVERHTIRVQLTTRDASLDPECDVRGEHFPFSFFMQNEEHTSAPSAALEERSLYEKSVEIRADVVDGELVIDNIVFHGVYDTKATPASDPKSQTTPKVHETQREETKVRYDNIFGGYPGPNLDEAEEEVLDGVQAWLAERCVDDQFGEFVGQYAVWVEQMEYERWLRQLREFVAA